MRLLRSIVTTAGCAVLGLGVVGVAVARGQAAGEVRVVYDEAKRGDFEPVDPGGEAAIRVDEPGVYEVRGTGVNAVDDADMFVFEVGGEKLLDFRLLADAAE